MWGTIRVSGLTLDAQPTIPLDPDTRRSLLRQTARALHPQRGMWNLLDPAIENLRLGQVAARQAAHVIAQVAHHGHPTIPRADPDSSRSDSDIAHATQRGREEGDEGVIASA